MLSVVLPPRSVNADANARVASSVGLSGWACCRVPSPGSPSKRTQVQGSPMSYTPEERSDAIDAYRKCVGNLTRFRHEGQGTVEHREAIAEFNKWCHEHSGLINAALLEYGSGRGGKVAAGIEDARAKVAELQVSLDRLRVDASEVWTF